MNNIVLVNSLIDANTDGVIMTLDCAKGSDSVEHEHLENVVFYVGCPSTKLATMHGVLHTKSLFMHSKQTGASAVEESQWIMCTLSADL